MKKSYFLPLLGLVLAGCANEDLLVNQGGQNEGSAPSSYLKISVVPTRGTTRGETRADAVYENGTTDESKVTAVRFFFFDGGGKAFPVWENRGTGDGQGSVAYNSYLDWYPNSSDITGNIQDQPTIETILKTTLGIVTPSGADNPASVLAVINPDAGVLGLNNISEFVNGSSAPITVFGPSLEELQKQVANYYTNLHADNFVMSNSVYVEPTLGSDGGAGEKNIITATIMNADNFGTSPDGEGAPKKNVEIYVERVLARVDFGISTEMTAKEVTPTPGDDDPETDDSGSFLIYSTGDPYTVNNTPTQIYVRFLGWNVTATTNQSRLIKYVNAGWEDATVFESSEPWNSNNYHRSFWAMNPENLSYQYGDFDGEQPAEEEGEEDDDNTRAVTLDKTTNVNPASALTIAPAGEYVKTYLQENANAYNAAGTPEAPAQFSKVIIAAQLCDVNGNPINLAEWNYHKYTVPNMLTFLTSNELNQLYYKTKGADNTAYTRIDPSQLEFKTAQQLDLKTDDADFYVYLVLTTDAQNLDWALKGLDGNFTPYNNYSAVNDYIYNKIHHVRVWNNGRTYYYFDIKHLGAEDSPGYYGIVRNHIYRSTVKSVQGLGTPVYDPDQIIIPEQNEYDESIVNADIKVLQWRVVENDYELVWK